MLHLSNEDVDRLVTPALALDAMRVAYEAWGRGDAAVQRRVRTDSGAVKLSTLGAVIDGAAAAVDGGVLGAKVYSTVAGQFTFLVVLFAGSNGRVLATLDAEALTRLRTAATSVLGAQVLANDSPSRLVVYGSGVQAQGHVRAFADAFDLRSVVVVGRTPPRAVAEGLGARTGVDVVATDDRTGALADADVVITATRATEPLFAASDIPAGVHVGAVGSSRVEAREIDPAFYAAADTVAVEWRDQAKQEAGGLVQAVAEGALEWSDVVELADLVAGRVTGRRGPHERTVLHSVGIGLEDIALAGTAWRVATA